MGGITRLRPGVSQSALLVGIGQRLRAEYGVDESPLPERLDGLLKQLERSKQIDRPSHSSEEPSQRLRVLPD